MRDYDVAIAGGGPAGAAAAITLARAGCRVCLADSDYERSDKPGDGLPPAATAMLRDLGVLERVLHESLHPQPPVVEIDWGDAAAKRFLQQLHGHDLHIDRARFDAVLRDAAAAAGARLYRQTRINLPMDSAPDREGWLPLRIRSGPGTERSIRCRWLIDASGRSSVLARRLGAQRMHGDRQSAFWLRLVGEPDRHDGPLIEAVEDGWWYSVPSIPGERIAAFLCDTDLENAQRFLQRDALWAQLTRAPRLHALCLRRGWTPQGMPMQAEAGSSWLDAAAGARWLAVGDAATGFDPLGAKGVASALYTGIRAAHALDAALRGQPEAIADYVAHVRQFYARYLGELRPLYRAEARWPASDFWRRRRDASDPVEIPIRSRRDAEARDATPQDG